MEALIVHGYNQALLQRRSHTCVEPFNMTKSSALLILVRLFLAFVFFAVCSRSFRKLRAGEIGISVEYRPADPVPAPNVTLCLVKRDTTGDAAPPTTNNLPKLMEEGQAFLDQRVVRITDKIVSK